MFMVLFVIGFCSVFGAVDNVAVLNAMPGILTDPAQAWDWYDMQVLYNLYDPLVYPTPEGSIRPHVALSWEPVDGDLAHWKFTIMAGYLFHDGTELTAEDVAWSMNRIKAMGGGGVMGDVTATATDFYTVDFVLGVPNAVFPETLTQFFILNKDLLMENLADGNYGENGDYGNAWLQENDAGSGPYMMTLNSPGDRLDAARFEEYFLGWPGTDNPDEVPIDQLIFKEESQFSTLLLLLKSGGLDLECDGGWSLPQLEEIDKTEGLRLNYVWSEDTTVFINTTRPPTDDEHFRKAILYAYDYEAVVEPYLPFGAGEGGTYLSRMPGFVPIEPQPRKKDLDKAREELALSKYADKLDEIPPIIAHFCAGLQNEEDVFLQLQADLDELGIKVEVAGPPWSQYGSEAATAEGTPHLTIWVFAPQYPTPDFYTYGMYHGPNWIYSAHWYFEDEEILQLLEQTRATLKFEDRIPLYEQVQPMIASHALAFFPYERQKAFPSQAYLVGPFEVTEMVGPNVNMRNWRINLKLKEELRG